MSSADPVPPEADDEDPLYTAGTTTVDHAGYFTFAAVPPGPARLRARTPAYTVVTSWVHLT